MSTQGLETNTGRLPRRSNTAPVQNQIQTPEKQLKETGTSSLVDAEFRPLVVRVLSERGREERAREPWSGSSQKRRCTA